MREGSRCWQNSMMSRALATWGWAWVAPCSMMLTAWPVTNAASAAAPKVQGAVEPVPPQPVKAGG